MYKYVCTSRIDTTIFVNIFQSIEKDNIWPKIRVFYRYIQPLICFLWTKIKRLFTETWQKYNVYVGIRRFLFMIFWNSNTCLRERGQTRSVPQLDAHNIEAIH
jgi:hypothetical protein